MKNHNPVPFILTLAAGVLLVGCAVELSASRGGESLHLQVKPATRPADIATVSVELQELQQLGR